MDATPGWDRSVDVLVVGSGAGGLTAALAAAAAGAETLLVEKASHYGGTTALSGGGIWAPGNPTLARIGRADDPASVRAYLDAVVGDRVPAARLDAFVHGAPRALEFLEGASEHLRFFWCRGYSDYHPERPGGRPDGRSIEALPFDTRLLGADEAALAPSPLKPPFGLYITATDFHDLNQVTRTWLGKQALLRGAGRVLANALRHRHMVTGGQALVGRLRLALRDAGGEVWLHSPLRELVTNGEGRVTGAVVATPAGHRRVEARNGVVLATGGFDHDPELRAKHLAPVSEDWSMGATTNRGDGIRAGTDAGAGVDLMDDAWWMPVIPLPKGRLFCLVSERATPGSLIVNQSGVRFANESAPYVTFVHEQIRRHNDGGGHIPAWFLMDHRARRRYTFAGIFPGQPFPKSWQAIGTVVEASSWEQLAAKTGLPADTLAETVERFNQAARAGVDADFARGRSAYDRYYGDPTLPNPCLNELVKPPFYAIKLLPGDLGTKGGLTTDEHARVLREDGTVIPGLYATGNTSASVMGNDYPGAGATIGPAIVFGWIAARHALDRAVTSADA
ncbi:FAD-dependent oxidoreductase [Acidiferrimicrobium sp. IK]|uniref:FAD-dependent oxidoreductase n=1 Tax=Acidiferrimicrobium sp. IK TaxID=2871700 RepID=UPI0021CAF20F|nr:FAD-dependent oxidoreductase [Acidiferrimicrobium sp. IK]MCU4184195.1 FAD-dependent oxidoreductase [Acidiferrimicrobium sp. IK]